MRVWRVVQERHEAHVLTGEGARLMGGRWNPEGVPLVYAAQTCALAVLEVRVNLPARPSYAYVAVEIEVADAEVTSLEEEEPQGLPDGWARSPYSTQTQALGLSWLSRGMRKEATVGLSVPSATLPVESVVLLNPLHPRFAAAVRIVGRHHVDLDPRMF